jgi:hypothetical protein
MNKSNHAATLHDQAGNVVKTIDNVRRVVSDGHHFFLVALDYCMSGVLRSNVALLYNNYEAELKMVASVDGFTFVVRGGYLYLFREPDCIMDNVVAIATSATQLFVVRDSTLFTFDVTEVV